MTPALVPLRAAFATGAWERACLDAARRGVETWHADLDDGSRLCVSPGAAGPAAVQLRGRGPAVLQVALENPKAWWPEAAGWESSDWRDTLLLKALAPVLEALQHWLPSPAAWACDWRAPVDTRAGTELPVQLDLLWSLAGEERRLSLAWASPAEAIAHWAGSTDDATADDDGDPQEVPSSATGPAREEPSTEARDCRALLHLSPGELAAVQAGGGLVLGTVNPAGCPLWLRAGDRWLLADAPDAGAAGAGAWPPVSRQGQAATAALDATLPVVAEDGALWVLGPARAVTPRALLEGPLWRPAEGDPDCSLWLHGRPVGQGRLIEHAGLAVLRVTGWQP